ncbi:hypothetical protein ONE63_009549 [Megalurothrips usitatus]|uniref:Uncharacterized protein n=1 Tax=Megalurothrips usitatus TaxID=439358 RepID=A0AAV7XLC9_9NEOP|nr:hypothetical protein ONE63_009549 [Megalurothrips usitatus]
MKNAGVPDLGAAGMWLLVVLLLPAARCGHSPPRTAIPLPPPTLSPEAQCALSLLPAYFGGEQSFGRIEVVASAAWVNDAFLGGLSVVGVPVTVEQDAEETQRAFITGSLLSSHNALIFVAVEDVNHLPNRLLVAPNVRYLVWLSTGAHALANFAAVRAKATQNCQMEMRLAVTSGVTTRLYSLDGGCQLNTALAAIGLSYSALPNVTELDRWSAAAGWQRGGPAPYRACVSWEPGPRGSDVLEVIIVTGTVSDEERRLAAVVVSALRRYRKLSERLVAVGPGLLEVWGTQIRCGTDLLIFPYKAFWRLLVGFPWQMEGLVAVVPAGRRLRGELGLSSLMKPLTATMWYATVGAVAAAGLGLWLHAAGNSCLDATLQAISPLWAQTVPVRAGRPRRVLGVWLLAAVVLSAAYQCDLRSTLAAPDVTTQITSERELRQSNLTIIFNKLLQVMVNRSWPTGSTLIEDMAELEGMRRVADRGDAALITDTTRLPTLLRGFERRVSTFRIAGTERIKSFLVTTRGSPLQAPLRTVIPRLRAAGLLERSVEPPRQTTESGQPRPVRLSWENVVPAFTVLGGGVEVAFMVFLVECVEALECLAEFFAILQMVRN